MTSIRYAEIYSRFYLKAEAYDILEYKEEFITEFLCGWLHSAINKPYIRRIFSTMNIDDEIQVIQYEMKYKVDDDFDRDLIIDILGIGMIIEWITPKIYSLQNIIQVYGSKEEKFYSQSGHLSTLQNLKKSLVREQRSIIRDRGYIWNTYLDGDK